MTTRLLAHGLMILLVLVSILPVWWMIATSLRAPNEILDTSPFPRHPSLANYREALDAIPVARMLLNTMVVSVAVTAIQVATAILAAWAFARRRFPFDRTVQALIAFTWLVPFRVVMIPDCVRVAELGLLDSLFALIRPHAAAAFAILLLLQSMRSFPREVIEAARMDGAGSWRTLRQVVVPNLRAPLAALAILVFISTWNEYFWPLLLTRAKETTVIQIGIQLFLTEEGNQWGPLMAAATMASLPVLLLYLLLQRQVIDSFVKAGLR